MGVLGLLGESLGLLGGALRGTLGIVGIRERWDYWENWDYWEEHWEGHWE